MLDSSHDCLGRLTFSFARAIQQPALDIWQGKDVNVPAAQQALYHRAKCNRMPAVVNTMPRWKGYKIVITEDTDYEINIGQP